MTITLERSTRKDKKYMVTLGDGNKIHFGGQGYADFTTSKDEEKKASYIARHKPRENWDKSGMVSAGFWSKHILWNKPTLSASIKDTEKRFGIDIVNKT